MNQEPKDRSCDCHLHEHQVCDKCQNVEAAAETTRPCRKCGKTVNQIAGKKNYLCDTDRKEYYRKWRAEKILDVRKYSKNYYHKRKREAIEHYGGIPPKCACCGESGYSFLTIDHSNGNGRSHRQEIKERSIYQWLRLHNYPEEGFQKCIAANPEIVELMEWCGWANKEDALKCKDCQWRARDIRLADVLYTLDEHNGPLGGGYMAQGDGLVIVDSWGVEVGSYSVATLLRLWKLRADDLDQQSDETISFIHSLLV